MIGTTKNCLNKSFGTIPMIFFLFLFSCGPIEQKVYIDRGNTYFNKGQYDEAISEYTKAIEINPRLAVAYNNRGIAYCDKRQYDQAISDYDKALEINPKYAKAYHNRGFTYYLKKEYEKCWEDVNKAKDLGYKVPDKVFEDLRKVSGRQNWITSFLPTCFLSFGKRFCSR